MTVRNEGEESFEFQFLLHSYWKISVSLRMINPGEDIAHYGPRTSPRLASLACRVPSTSTRSWTRAHTSRRTTHSSSLAKSTASTRRSPKTQLPSSKMASPASMSSATTSRTPSPGTHGSRRQRPWATSRQMMATRTWSALRLARWMAGRSWRRARSGRVVSSSRACFKRVEHHVRGRQGGVNRRIMRLGSTNGFSRQVG